MGLTATNSTPDPCLYRSRIPRPLVIIFTTTTTSNIWYNFLECLQRHIQTNYPDSKGFDEPLTAPPNVNIVTRVVAYASLDARLSYDMNNIDNSVPTTTLEAVRQYRARQGSLYVFQSPMDSAFTNKPEDAPSYWHIVVVHIQGGIVGIYDSNFIGMPKNGRLINVNGVRLVVKFLREIRKRYSIKAIWMGGGGNPGLECTDMTRRWLISEIYEKRGAALGNWSERAGWIKLRL